MKIVVMGGFGRVGARPIEILADQDVEVASASRRTGVDAESGEGLEAALAGADVVVALAKLVLAEPRDVTVELAGQDSFRLDAIVEADMAATGDPRRVVRDAEALCFGARCRARP